MHKFGVASKQEWQWLSFQELCNSNEWWEIYETSFPAAEREPKEQLLEALKSGIATIGAFRSDKNITAILVFYAMEKLPFIYLSYIAISKSMRNQGLGQKLFPALIAHAKTMITPSLSTYFAVVWEVEDPAQAATVADKILRERRIKFYKNRGAQFLNTCFIQPPVDGLNYVPLRLMCYMLNPEINIHRHEKSIIQSIYFEKYHIVNKIKMHIIQDLCDQIFMV